MPKLIFDRFLIQDNSTVEVALNKIQANHCKTVFVFSSSGAITGVISDRDVRKTLINQGSISAGQNCASISNKSFRSAKNRTEAMDILNDSLRAVPILSDNGHLLDIVFNQPSHFFVNQTEVGGGSGCYVIAEIGVNHDGDVEKAKELIIAAKDSGANAVKFQMRDIPSLFGKFYLENRASLDLGSQYQLEHLEQLNLSVEDHAKLGIFAASWISTTFAPRLISRASRLLKSLICTR